MHCNRKVIILIDWYQDRGMEIDRQTEIYRYTVDKQFYRYTSLYKYRYIGRWICRYTNKDLLLHPTPPWHRTLTYRGNYAHGINYASNVQFFDGVSVCEHQSNEEINMFEK